jgi:hypothetical protein
MHTINSVSILRIPYNIYNKYCTYTIMNRKISALGLIAAATLVLAAIAPAFFVEADAVVTQTNRQDQRQSNNQQGAVNVGANVGVQAGNVCVICT